MLFRCVLHTSGEEHSQTQLQIHRETIFCFQKATCFGPKWPKHVAGWKQKYYFRNNSVALCDDVIIQLLTERTIFFSTTYEGWNFNSGNYLFTTDTK